ncbi:MAG TPA: hypothetical protein VKB57_28105 [Acidimicrobiales bacterium]|nr:hypothetical protein [Acidimicrobiales bacterium]
MAGTDDRDDDRLPGRARRHADDGTRSRDEPAGDGADDEIEAVTRLMGYLRSDET